MQKNEFDTKLKELIAERAREERKVERVPKIGKLLLQDRLFLEQLQDQAEEIFAEKIVVPRFHHKKARTIKRHQNLLLSDLHLHAMLDGIEVPLKYGPEEEARALSNIVIQAADYKTQYRDDTVLNVSVCGDIIQGSLHDPRDGAPLAQQSAAAMHLLTQAIGFLAANYPKVIVRCTPGNHGRNQARHKERAIHQKWDSIENIIYYGVKIALAHVPNVEVEIPYTPYITYDSFGAKVFGTHGDTVINPGNPGKSINIESLRKQINEWNSRLSASERYQLFFVGHVHTASSVVLPNGVRFISNGCLVPPDSYSVASGYNTTCGQWIWESVPGHVVGDMRFIVVDEKTYCDTSLNVVKPFEKF